MGGADPEDEAEEVSPDKAPDPLKRPHNINDNYCIVNPVPVAQSVSCVKSVSNQDFSVTVQVPVSCPVVSPVCSVINVQRPSQKKDIRPLSKTKREINSVKGASIVGHCVFAQNIPAPQYCTCSAGGKSSAKLMADMVPPGRKSKGSVDLERRLHSPIQTQTTSGERSIDSQWVYKSAQEPLPEGSFARTDPQEGSREGKGSNLSNPFQQVIHSTKTKSEMASNLGSPCPKQILSVKTFKMETPEII